MFKRFARIVVIALVLFGAIGLTAGCKSDADVASHNLSKDADNYKVPRQIVVYNSITDKYILEVDGFCALGNDDPSYQVSYTCKTDDGLVKDIIQKSDNTFVFVHQLEATKVSTDYYKVILKPESIIPDLDVR